MTEALSAQAELFTEHVASARVMFSASAGALSKERLPTNTTTERHAVHRWFNFIAGFSPEFVHQCCDSLQRRMPCLLLDPFVGCGTAPVVAKQRGMESLSFDPHPIFARIAKAKLATVSLDEVGRIEDVIMSGLKFRRSN